MDSPPRTPRPEATPAAAPPAEADLSGTVIGEFKLLRRLGQGGMGQVYLAEQLSLRRQIALKIVRPELADSANAATLIARFRAEAEAVARATHANIVQIYAIGQAADVNYMALEYVEGRNLRGYIERKGTLAAATGLKIMAQVAAALHRAGELGIVHRDIKPENILVTRSGEVKVADFGLSRCFDQPLGLTKSGVVMGTPLYMSPEQVETKRPVDHRSDQYSFGATCYFMFAGVPPFRGETPLEVAYQHVNKEPELLGQWRPDLPPAVCAMIHKMMAKKPEDRYQTTREVVREIAALREQLLAASGPMSMSLTEVRVPASPTMQGIGKGKATGHGVRYVLATLTILLALGLGVLIGWYRRQTPPADNDGGQTLSARQANYQSTYHAATPVTADATGLKNAVALGLFYLQERRLDDADKFFQGLCPDKEKWCSGRLLSRLGEAMVLAFRNDAKASNQVFRDVYREFKHLETKAGAKVPADVDVYKLLWKTPPLAAELRETVARALRFNEVNDPAHFPPELRAWLGPPGARGG